MESDVEAGNNGHVQSPDEAHASSSGGQGQFPSSNGNGAHEDGQSTAGPQKTPSTYSRLQTIVIDPEAGEARNAATGETMEMPLQPPRTTPSTPPPVPITEFQHLASESDLKGIEAALDEAVTPEGAIKNHDGRDLDLLTLGTRTLRTVGYGDTMKLDRPQDRALQQVMVSSGTVEKTRTERRQEKKEKKEKKKEKGSSSDPADSEVSDPSATPPSAPENNRPIYFQYAEGSMNLTMMVSEDFNASLNSLEMKQVCAQVSNIYCSRLGFTSSVSDMKFNFMSLAPDCILVTLKDDETGLGFEDQVKTFRTSLSDALVQNETLEQSLCNFQAQPKVKGADSEMLQSRVSVLEGENTTHQQRIKLLEGKNTTHRQQIEQLQSIVAMQGSLIEQLLYNVELRYKARRSVILEMARSKLLTKLQKSRDNFTWKEFIENSSQDEKSVSGASDSMLLKIGTGMLSLNKAMHQDGSLEEMAHAVNVVSPPGTKIVWQDLFTYVYGQHPELIGLGYLSL